MAVYWKLSKYSERHFQMKDYQTKNEFTILLKVNGCSFESCKKFKSYVTEFSEQKCQTKA